jgi:hypothetical protein
MPVKLRPGGPKARELKISERAVELFDAMMRAEASCTCEDNSTLVPRDTDSQPCPACKRWGKLHNELWHELHCKLWEDAVEDPDVECPSWANAEVWSAAQERWRMLEQARRAGHRRGGRADRSADRRLPGRPGRH